MLIETTTDTLLIDATQRLFGEQCTRRVLESAELGHWPAALWDAVESVGLPLAARSEARGGVGASSVELAQMCRLAGRHALPLPLVETLLAEQMLAAAGLAPLDGPLSVGPVLVGDSLGLREQHGQWRLDGRLARVPWGRDAGAIVAVARDGQGLERTVVIRKPAVKLQGSNYAFEPRDAFSFSELPVDAVDVGAAGQGWTAGQLMQHGALARSLQIAGALERCLEQTVQYARDRVQFGKPIGKFQAVQHQIAQMASHVAAALSAALSAAAMRSPLETAMAKTRTSEAAGLAAGVAHQVLGAIGFTHEHMLHFSTRRLWSWRDEFGSDEYWAVWVGQHLAREAEGEGLWALLTAGDARVGQV